MAPAKTPEEKVALAEEKAAEKIAKAEADAEAKVKAAEERAAKAEEEAAKAGAKEQTPDEKNQAKIAAKKAKAEESEKNEKKVTVTLRCGLLWKGRRRKAFDEIEVTETQKKQLDAAGQLASAEDLKNLKAGKPIKNY